MADYTVEIKPGSTVLELEVPSLQDASPETFGQLDFLSDIDPERSSFDYFRESLEAAIRGRRDSPLYDRGLLEVFRRLEKAMRGGAERITVGADEGLVLTASDLHGLATLEAEIPPPRYVRFAGILDQIRASDRTFTIRSTTRNLTIKGIADPDLRQQLQDFWGKSVLVGGMAHFTPAGGDCSALRPIRSGRHPPRMSRFGALRPGAWVERRRRGSFGCLKAPGPGSTRSSANGPAMSPTVRSRRRWSGCRDAARRAGSGSSREQPGDLVAHPPRLIEPALAQQRLDLRADHRLARV